MDSDSSGVSFDARSASSENLSVTSSQDEIEHDKLSDSGIKWIEDISAETISEDSDPMEHHLADTLPYHDIFTDNTFSEADLDQLALDTSRSKLMAQLGPFFSSSDPLSVDHFQKSFYRSMHVASSMLEYDPSKGYYKAPKSLEALKHWLRAGEADFLSQHERVCDLLDGDVLSAWDITDQPQDGPMEKIPQALLDDLLAGGIVDSGLVCLLGPRGSGKSYLLNRVLKLLVEKKRHIDDVAEHRDVVKDVSAFASLPAPILPLRIIRLQALQTQDPFNLVRYILTDLKMLQTSAKTHKQSHGGSDIPDDVFANLSRSLQATSRLLGSHSEQIYNISRLRIIKEKYSVVLDQLGAAIKEVTKRLQLVLVVEDFDLLAGNRQTFLYNLMDIMSAGYRRQQEAPDETHENAIYAAKKPSALPPQSRSSSSDSASSPDSQSSSGSQSSSNSSNHISFDQGPVAEHNSQRSSDSSRLSEDEESETPLDRPLEAVHSHNVIGSEDPHLVTTTPITAVMLTAQLDSFSLLEKRVASRFPQRQIILDGPLHLSDVLCLLLQHLFVLDLPLSRDRQVIYSRRELRLRHKEESGLSMTESKHKTTVNVGVDVESDDIPGQEPLESWKTPSSDRSIWNDKQRHLLLRWNESVLDVFEKPSLQLKSAIKEMASLTLSPMDYLALANLALSLSATLQLTSSLLAQAVRHYLSHMDTQIQIGLSCSPLQILLMIEMHRLEQQLRATRVKGGPPFADFDLPSAAKAIDLNTAQNFNKGKRKANGEQVNKEGHDDSRAQAIRKDSFAIRFYHFERVYFEYSRYVLSEPSLKAFKFPKDILKKEFEGLIQLKFVQPTSLDRYHGTAQTPQATPLSSSHQMVTLVLSTSQLKKIIETYPEPLPEPLLDRLTI